MCFYTSSFIVQPATSLPLRATTYCIKQPICCQRRVACVGLYTCNQFQQLKSEVRQQCSLNSCYINVAALSSDRICFQDRKPSSIWCLNRISPLVMRFNSACCLISFSLLALVNLSQGRMTKYTTCASAQVFTIYRSFPSLSLALFYLTSIPLYELFYSTEIANGPQLQKEQPIQSLTIFCPRNLCECCSLRFSLRYIYCACPVFTPLFLFEEKLGQCFSKKSVVGDLTYCSDPLQCVKKVFTSAIPEFF